MKGIYINRLPLIVWVVLLASACEKQEELNVEKPVELLNKEIFVSRDSTYLNRTILQYPLPNKPIPDTIKQDPEPDPWKN